MRTMQDSMGVVPFSIKIRYGLKEKEHTAHKLIKNIVENCTPPQLITLHPRSKYVSTFFALLFTHFRLEIAENSAIRKRPNGIMCRSVLPKRRRRKFHFGYAATFIRTKIIMSASNRAVLTALWLDEVCAHRKQAFCSQFDL